MDYRDGRTTLPADTHVSHLIINSLTGPVKEEDIDRGRPQADVLTTTRVMEDGVYRSTTIGKHWQVRAVVSSLLLDEDGSPLREEVSSGTLETELPPTMAYYPELALLRPRQWYSEQETPEGYLRLDPDEDVYWSGPSTKR